MIEISQNKTKYDTAKGDWFENNQARSEYLQEFRVATGQEILFLTLSDF